MLTSAELKGQWNQLKGQIKERWGDFTDNEYLQMQGGTDQLIGIIQKKTGSARQEIEKFLSGTLGGAESAAANAMEGVRQAASKATDAASRAGDAVRDQYDRIADGMSDTYDNARDMVRRQPEVSVGVAFAAGVLGGAILGLLMRSSR